MIIEEVGSPRNNKECTKIGFPDLTKGEPLVLESDAFKVMTLSSP